MKIRRPVAMLSASAPTSRARSMRAVLISGGRSAAATWALVKADGIPPCESIPALVAASRANPRSPSFESAELCSSGQREEGIDCWGFSALAASVDVCGVDCPVSADAVGRASSVGCSVRELPSLAGGLPPHPAARSSLRLEMISMTQLDDSLRPRPLDASTCGGLQGRHGSTNGYPEAVGPSAR